VRTPPNRAQPRKKRKSRNDGRDLQRIVHPIETALRQNPNIKVESPKRLVDKDTGRLREHDVVLTFTEGHHEILCALECRDRSRPVGVPAVEAFHNTMRCSPGCRWTNGPASRWWRSRPGGSVRADPTSRLKNGAAHRPLPPWRAINRPPTAEQLPPMFGAGGVRLRALDRR
jgi:hypothetical protein